MVYGYLRVSTDKQDENNQRLGVADKAKKMGAPVDEYVIDSGVSGTVEPKKRKLGALIKKLQPGDTIIASELSRLGRSLMMIMSLLERLMKLSVKVVTVKDNYVLGNDIQSQVLAFAFGISAQIERDMISQRTKEALARKAGEGIILGRPKGSASGHRKLAPYHKEIVRYLNDGLSYSAISRLAGVNRNTVKGYCAEHKIEKPRGKAHGGKGGKSKPVLEERTTIRELLKMIKRGTSYEEMSVQFGISSGSVRNYIQARKRLFDEYVKVQNGIRVTANGGLKINKKHGR